MKKIKTDKDGDIYESSGAIIIDEFGHDPSIGKSGGSSIRDVKYRKRLLASVKKHHNKDNKHPIFNGVVMAAHHLISIEGLHLSGLDDEVKFKGYNINFAKNLIFLPYELEGACHLGVQVHRGNHVKKIMGKTYHQMVKHLLSVESDKIVTCHKDADATLKALISTMNKISREILKLIKNYKVHLTDIATSFDEGSNIGCANAGSLPGFKTNRLTGQVCSHGRNHQSSDDIPIKTKKGYEITLPKSTEPYKLEAGK